MRFDNPAANGQPNSDASGFRREEGVEQAIDVVRVDARTIVLHRNDHLTDIVLLRLDQQFVRSVANRRHGLNTICQEIDDDLLQLNPITTHQRQIGSEVESQEDAITEQLRLDQRDNFLDNLIQVQFYSSDANAPALRDTVSGITNSRTIIKAVSANSTS